MNKINCLFEMFRKKRMKLNKNNCLFKGFQPNFFGLDFTGGHMCRACSPRSGR